MVDVCVGVWVGVSVCVWVGLGTRVKLAAGSGSSVCNNCWVCGLDDVSGNCSDGAQAARKTINTGDTRNFDLDFMIKPPRKCIDESKR